MTLLTLLEIGLEAVDKVTLALERRPASRKESKEVMRKRLVWGLCSLLMWLVILAIAGGIAWAIYTFASPASR